MRKRLDDVVAGIQAIENGTSLATNEGLGSEILLERDEAEKARSRLASIARRQTGDRKLPDHAIEELRLVSAKHHGVEVPLSALLNDDYSLNETGFKYWARLLSE